MARKAHDVTNAEETYLLRHSMELSPLRMQRPLVQPMPARWMEYARRERTAACWSFRNRRSIFL